MKNIILLFLAFILLSCNGTTDSTTTNATLSKTQYFKLFIKRFKQLPLPLLIEDDFTKRYDVQASQIDRSSYDSLFIKDAGYNTCYGILTDTSKFYSLLFFYPGDVLVPILMNFTKDGEKIAEAKLYVTGFSRDQCGVYRSSSTGLIKKDLSIYCADSVFYFPCDSLEEVADSTKKGLNVVHQESRINADGSVTVSEEKKQSL